MTADRFAEAFGAWTPRAVVFDCDGLLLDTERVWDETQATILRRLGTTLGPEEEAGIIGSSVETAAKIIAGAAGADVEEVTAAIREQFVADIAADLETMPGAADVIEATAARLPIACASNSWHEALVDKLERTGLLEAFSDLESTDTVEHGKPAPDMYARAAAQLGVQPGEALAFEDSPTGARAALAAGLRLIAVPMPGTEIEGADLVIDSLEDPALLAWIDSWPQRRR